MLALLAAQAADLGKTQVPLEGAKIAATETVLGDLVTDALRHATNADIAIMHAMAFRAQARIPDGPVSEQAFRDLLAAPESKIITLQLTPVLLRTIMQRSLARTPHPNTAFLQFSGMQVLFDGAKPPAERVTGILVGGKALNLADTKTTFTVAMPSQLAIGAVGYLFDFTDDALKTLTKTDISILDAVTKEFATHDGHLVNPKVEGRLKDVNPAK